MVPQLLSSDNGRCPWCAGRADSQVQVWSRQSSFTVAVVEKSVKIPRVFLDKVVDMPVGVQQQVLGLWLLKTADSLQLQFIDKVWTSLRFCSDVVSQWAVPQIQLSPDLVDIPVRNRDRSCRWVR